MIREINRIITMTQANQNRKEFLWKPENIVSLLAGQRKRLFKNIMRKYQK